MTVLWILSVILLAVIFLKWLVFIFVSPLIILHFKRERAKAAALWEEDCQTLREKSRVPEPPSNSTTTIFSKIKRLLYRYLSGFERYMIIKTGYIPSHHIRDFIYRRIFLIEIVKGAVIYYGAEIRGPYNLHLEKGAVVGDRCVLDARRGFIKIGTNVQLGNFVKLWTGSHDMNDPWFRSMPGKRGPIIIEDYAWIGPDVTILNSVTIGKGAVIAAGAVVTRDVEPFSLMAGVPAKKIGERSKNLKYDLSKSYVPFY